MVNTPSPGSVAGLVAQELQKQSRSVRSLSEAADIPYTTLTRKLRGRTDIGANEIVIIAEALGVHPSAITPQILKSESAS